MHGVFMDILGLGVLITGESGLGKSELGLELISRGHGLVADDAVDLYRVNQTTLEGRCPELLHEPARGARHRPARHQGDLRRDGGAPEDAPEADRPPGAARRRMEREYERLPYEPLTQDVLGVPVRKAVIPVVAGRNLAVLVEAAVRNTILQLRGIDTYAGVRRAPPPGDGARPTSAAADPALAQRCARLTCAAAQVTCRGIRSASWCTRA